MDMAISAALKRAMADVVARDPVARRIALFRQSRLLHRDDHRMVVSVQGSRQAADAGGGGIHEIGRTLDVGGAAG